MSQLPQSEMDDIMGTLRVDSYESSKPLSPRDGHHLDPIPKRKVLTMDDFDGIMPSFGTYIHTLEADREKLCAEWRDSREPPTGTAEAMCAAIRLMSLSRQSKIKYCNELTCSFPNCEHSGHDGHMPRTKCGCGCPE